MTIDVELIKQEAKTLKFTITDNDGTALDITSATLSFELRPDRRTATAEVIKTDDDFTKSDPTNGICKLPLSSDDLDRNGTYYGLLTIQFSASNVDKSFHVFDIANT